MKSLQTIFSATLKENAKENNLSSIISEFTCELSKKKIQRLKDDSSIQKRLGELFELFVRALQTEGLNNTQNIDAVISGLIKAASHDKEEFLYKTLYEKEQLEKSIIRQRLNIRNNIAETFKILESHIQTMDTSISKESLKALHDTELRGVEMLGILEETTTEALLTTLEKGQDIEDTVFEITKNITYQTINEGEFTKNRFKKIISSILKVTIEIADEDQGNAKSLLKGAIHGTKEGAAKAIDKFKNDFKLAPEEVSTKDLTLIKNDLANVENEFIEIVKATKSKSNGASIKIIDHILENDINNSLSKIRRVAQETKNSLSDKIEELNIGENEFVKKASEKFESIKQDERTISATKEAKRLGNHAWEAAKGVLDGAFKGAKDIINKKK